MSRGRADSGLRRYLSATNTVSFGIMAVLPLLVLYELGIHKLQSQWRNCAEYYLKRSFDLAFPEWAFWIWWAGICTAVLFAAIVQFRHRTPFVSYLSVQAFEGIVLGALLGPVTLAIHRVLLPASHAVPLAGGAKGDADLLDAVLFVGAGIYEELVFRLILLSLIYFLLFYFLGRNETGARRERGRWIAAGFAVVISSLIFSGYHHWGPEGEVLDTARFAFRAVGGALLGMLFVLRGFGSVVYTHASYDLMVIFFFPILQSR